MSPSRASRLDEIPGFGIDRVAAAAGDDPSVLRLENLDTDIPPPAAAIEATRAAAGGDDANSYLPFTGRADLKARSRHVARRSGTPRALTGHDHLRRGRQHARRAARGRRSGRRGRPHRPRLRGDAQPRAARGRRARLVPSRSRTAHGDSTSTRWRRIGPRTRAVFLMNPSFPTGAVLSAAEWDAVARSAGARPLASLLVGDGGDRVRRRARPAPGGARRDGRADDHDRRRLH